MTGAESPSRCQCHDGMNEETNCNGMAQDLAARNELQTDLALCLAVPVGFTDRTSCIKQKRYYLR